MSQEAATVSSMERPRASTLVHFSDLHIGSSPEREAHLAALLDEVGAAGCDRVVVTGDITHRGRAHEWARFETLFAPFAARGQLSVVPGNHDRLGDDVAATVMPNARVTVDAAPGLHVVRFDSTGPHNRSWIRGHGALSASDIDDITAALDAAPAGALAVLLLHHHPLPLRADQFFERLLINLGTPFCAELPRGPELLAKLRGRCDLVLHGHRHHATALTFADNSARPLQVCSAGCSPDLRRVRVFTHAAGRLLAPASWIEAAAHEVAPTAATRAGRRRRRANDTAPVFDGAALA